MTSLFLSISIEFVSFSLFRWSYLFLDEYTPDLIRILTCKEGKEKKKGQVGTGGMLDRYVT